jgi:hypothetical protein
VSNLDMFAIIRQKWLEDSQIKLAYWFRKILKKKKKNRSKIAAAKKKKAAAAAKKKKEEQEAAELAQAELLRMQTKKSKGKKGSKAQSSDLQS